MNLRQVRELFIERSGRADLGSPVSHLDTGFSIASFTPTASRDVGFTQGADFFINEAQKFLDDRYEQPELKSCLVSTLEGGENTLVFPNRFRYITQVLWNEKLLYQRAFDLRMLTVATDEPAFWSFAPMHCIVDKKKIAAKEPKSWFGADFLKNEATCRSIILSPKPQDTGQVFIMGMAFSEPLEKDGDVSVWSTKYPDILITAALWKLELSYRNTEGANDYYKAMEIAI